MCPRKNRNTPPPAEMAPSTSGAMWTEFLKERDRVDKLTKDLEGVKAELSEEKATRETFAGAVRRYLEKLNIHWPGPAPMPDPDEDDREILQLTLPKRRRYRPTEPSEG